MKGVKGWIRKLVSLFILFSMTGCSLVQGTQAASGFQEGVYAISNYKLKFEKGHYTLLTQFDQEIAQGSFKIDSSRIVFNETDFGPECGAEYSSYSYGWALDGKALKFSDPQDRCLARIDFLTGHPWMYQGK